MSLIRTHKYNNYQDYVNFQLIKTKDKSKQKKWLNKEWRLKIDIFKNVFNTNINIIKKLKKGLCLGARTGQEVLALQELGLKDTIGIDLHEFPPYTIKGDIHNLNFPDNTFDFEFSNIFDHSIYPDKFINEIERTLKLNGIIIFHLQLNINQDKYTEIIIKNLNSFKSLFKKCKIISERKINTGIIAMNYEIVLQKIN
tara:strand:+ start:764 stop:1357 length:594 start_codon:yes stop_codon:yes gene_type:complete